MRIRLKEKDGMIHATVVKTMKTGTIDKKYISKSKISEIKEHGFAYINQPKERVV